MKKVMKFRYRILALLVLAVVLSAATYGFAAANTVPANTHAGYGEGVISGYEVTDVNYTLDSSNPNLFSSVDFNMTELDSGDPVPATAEVLVGIGDGTGTTGIDWVTCNTPVGTSVTCPLGSVGVSVTAAVEFHVAATD